MSYKEKPQLHLYEYKNNSFIQTAIIDDYKEVSFERNLYSAGTFTITINYNIPNALLFERGMFIQFGSDPYDFGEILSIRDSIGQDGKDSQIRTITGYDARYIFKRRIIKNLNSNGMWKMTAKGEVCLRNLVADQCGVNAETKRRLPIINAIPSAENAIGKEYSVSEQFTNLYEVCKTIATQSEIGWRVKFDNGSLKLECFEGTDRSNTVQFSTDFDSLRNGEFSDSSESYSNAIYIGGKGQNDERDIYEGEDGTPNGLDRFEAWDDQSQMTTTDEYTAEALSMLSQYGQTVNVSGNGLAKCPYIYKEQYDVGDIITIAFSGKTAKVQILSVTERWAWNQYDINFSFGKPQNNLAEQLQLMLRKIQGASNKANATESVKWYTIPTATSMLADDVTFNTIGFTGTMTANSTFTLYRDSEGTGAKSYNIYTKNLSGNYNLTLTTGVSGKSNFTIKGGQNIVARILVDEEGNIISQGMTATSVIESGNTQPATSGGVADAIQDVVDVSSSLPTDAVLHYSFDDVPDYPDGTATLRQMEFSDTGGWTATSDMTLTVENNSLKIQSTGTRSVILATHSALRSATLKGQLVKLKLISPNPINSCAMQEQKGPSYPSYLLTKISQSGNEYIYAGVMPTDITAFSYLVIGYQYQSQTDYILLEQIYIGDGSYSTPIIDNANGQNNVTNNGGIATKGVSGKGVYFLNGKYATANNFNFTDNFSISVWVKPDNMENGKKREIVSKSRCFFLRNGDGGSNNYLFGAVYNKSTSIYAFFIVQSTLLDNTKYTHICITKNGTTVKAFVDGGSRRITNLNFTEMNINNNNLIINATDNTSPQSVDDLLIFDRALSDTEVKALYQNKANTPKYYSWADWKLSQV